MKRVCALQIGINGVVSLPNSQIESLFKTQVVEDHSTRLIACAGWVEKKSKKSK